MKKLTEQEILEKWAHIAMKTFPPQTQITPASATESVIRVRWRAENDPESLSASGVDLHFPKELLAQYLMSDAETELKWDAFIERSISERLRTFDPYQISGGTPRIETWRIDPGVPAPAV